MSLDSIIEHILSQAHSQAQGLIAQAKKEADKNIQEVKREAEALYQALLDNEKSFLERQKQKLIVNTRLASKKNILLAKQELINVVFDRIKTELGKISPKKQRVSHDKVQEVLEDLDFYLKQLRLDYESQIAGILFS